MRKVSAILHLFVLIIYTFDNVIGVKRQFSWLMNQLLLLQNLAI